LPQVSHLTELVCSILAKELDKSELKSLHEVKRDKGNGKMKLSKYFNR
jgi:hypothetical protein